MSSVRLTPPPPLWKGGEEMSFVRLTPPPPFGRGEKK